MKYPIYELKYPEETAKILNDLQKRCAKNFGVTLVGNRLTLRWGVGSTLQQVHMIIENVDDGIESEESDQ